MTVEEYRQALTRLTPEEFKTFRERWGGTRDTVEACVQEFAYAPDPAQWERIIIFRLRQLGVEELKTEGEKVLATAQDSAEAAKSSARAAELSAAQAADSVRVARRTLFVAVIAVAASILLAFLRP